ATEPAQYGRSMLASPTRPLSVAPRRDARRRSLHAERSARLETDSRKSYSSRRSTAATSDEYSAHLYASCDRTACRDAPAELRRAVCAMRTAGGVRDRADAARRSLGVEHVCVRRDHDALTCPRRSPAEVEVVAKQRQPFVEPAEQLPGGAPDEHACTAHGEH